MNNQNRRDPTKNKKQQKSASSDTMKTAKKGGTELTDEQLGQASGGAAAITSRKAGETPIEY